ncbi:L,D-transpeptidase [Streptomyces sp. NBC_01803]|uniref:L,D-transpeptidase n=1 Tax=Streptomyces sp. NBC_01803 TaxID=2975946 RepID=UPI002DDAC9E7|nr:L,D-transpeptidase [Streptomyces sp. NBC_01803]WSA44374.1 L,D-transpeptidase [Streptomyces sp. NBC_01803]
MPNRQVPTATWISLLTAGALVIVTALAVQARDDAPASAAPGTSEPSASPTADGTASADPSPEAPAVPEDSGDGRRVVYSLGQEQVWLVGDDNTATRTFTVWPGTVTPEVGTYTVSYRRPESTGSDGAPIENIVYFTVVGGISIGFSNAVDGASPSPGPGVETGGIRSRAEDGDAVWEFTEVGTTVRVVG